MPYIKMGTTCRLCRWFAGNHRPQKKEVYYDLSKQKDFRGCCRRHAPLLRTGRQSDIYGGDTGDYPRMYPFSPACGDYVRIDTPTLIMMFKAVVDG